MAATIGQVIVDLKAQTAQFHAEMRRTAGQFNSSLERMKSDASKFRAYVVGAFAAIGGAQLFRNLIEQNRNLESMKGSLQTVTGSAEAAAGAMQRLMGFAEKTPFTLDQSIQAFIKLKALGLDPSERAMMSYGNTASAMGKDMVQMIEAVADASTGEMERLKEFGIKAKQEGDKVQFVFRGTTTEVARNAQAIQEYLIKIGETDFGGAMERQMAGLPGKLSNLEDSISRVAFAIGEGGFTRAVASASEALAGWISSFVESGGAARIGEVLGGSLERAAKAIQENVAGIKAAVGALAGAAFPTVLKAIAGGFMSVAVAVKQLTVALAKNPLTLLGVVLSTAVAELWIFRDELVTLGGTTAQVGDFVAAAWTQTWRVLGDVWEGIKAGAAAVAASFGGIFEGMSLNQAAALQVMGPVITRFFTGALQGAKLFTNFVIGLFSAIPRVVATAAGAIYEHFRDAFTKISELARTFGEGFLAVFNFDFSFASFRDTLQKDVLAPTQDVMSQVVDSFLDSFRVDYLSSITGSIADFSKAAITETTEYWRDFWERIKTDAAARAAARQAVAERPAPVGQPEAPEAVKSVASTEGLDDLLKQMKKEREEQQKAMEQMAGQLTMEFDPQAKYAKQVSDLNALREEGLISAEVYTRALAAANIELRRSLEDLLVLSRQWVDGAVVALAQYADAAKDAAKNFHEVFTNTFKSLEDQLTEFFTTLKLNFKSLIDSIRADLTRVFVRQQITGPLASWLGQSVLGGPEELFNFGGFRAAGGTVEPGTAYVVGERGKELFIPQQPGLIVPNEKVSSFTKVVESVREYMPFGTGGKREALAGATLFTALQSTNHSREKVSSFSKVLETVRNSAREKVNNFSTVLESVKEYLPFGGFRAAGGRVEPGMAYVVGEAGREAYVPDVSVNVPGMRSLAAAGVPSGDGRGGVEISGDINVYVDGGQGQGTWRRAGVQIAEEAMLSLREARSVM